MKYITFYFLVIALSFCRKKNELKLKYYPPIETDSAAIISLTANNLFKQSLLVTDRYCIDNFTFANGPLHTDSIAPNEVIRNYSWELGSPFTIKYVGESELIVSDSLKSRSGSTLVYALDTKLKGKELFEIFIDTTHLFNRIFAPTGQDVKIILSANADNSDLYSTRSIESGFRFWMLNENLSKIIYGITH